jgi:hypothetical protein
LKRGLPFGPDVTTGIGKLGFLAFDVMQAVFQHLKPGFESTLISLGDICCWSLSINVHATTRGALRHFHQAADCSASGEGDEEHRREQGERPYHRNSKPQINTGHDNGPQTIAKAAAATSVAAES